MYIAYIPAGVAVYLKIILMNFEDFFVYLYMRDYHWALFCLNMRASKPKRSCLWTKKFFEKKKNISLRNLLFY